ncbi:unnamed protein product [Rotaria sordida]|uniref:Uncharacterized protein n=1 Tax=Rotaria sordida TaxID=392033 RepID=A0A814AZ82_9BILA|nr:unnamed protein product [Rotaria sordida]CAF1046365.1 unnamed protein product [Rotaria sordida]CAF3546975.1 unnamed protein product [Rotaria sordida]CAF3571037.1 unnamed protein product [Rotaria sordida]CAF3610990.1 unnamed protein product [Rotaria sordida]
MDDTIKSLKDELDEMKKKYIGEQRKNELKYNKNLNSINQIFTSTVCSIFEKMKTENNNTEVDGIINATLNQLAILNNEKSTYLTH